MIDPSWLAGSGAAGMICLKPGSPHRANAHLSTRDV
jgi:hypothetical protein